MNPAIPPDLPQPTQNGAVESPDPQFRHWYYCMDENHPGVPKFSQAPMDLGRIFGVDTNEGCPVCPDCKKEVSAVPTIGPHYPPAEIAAYAERFARMQTGGTVR